MGSIARAAQLGYIFNNLRNSIARVCVCVIARVSHLDGVLVATNIVAFGKALQNVKNLV